MTQQTAPEKDHGERQGAFSLLGTASTMGLHMVSGPVVGAGLGWLIDGWLGSWPIASAIGLFLGIWAGFRNVWADARYLERSNAANDAAEKQDGESRKLNDNNELSHERPAGGVELVPNVDKRGAAAATPARPVFAPDVPARPGFADEEGEDLLTASILAGTAASADRGLDEVDETMEAIRRVLRQDEDAPGPGKALGKGPGKPLGGGE